LFLQTDRSKSDTTSAVIVLDPAGNQVNDTPLIIADDAAKTEWIESLYLQDEWKIIQPLTLNFGLRFDKFTAFASGHQIGPRVNAVWQALTDTVVHAGYSRYLSPPPLELVGNETVGKFLNTTAAPSVAASSTPQAEQANCYDVGVQRKVAARITLGLDTFYKQSHNLIDEGPFGALIILTPFNYAEGKQYGAELAGNYAADGLTAYLNLAYQSAKGKDIDSSQFNFSPQKLDYISSPWIHLDHEQQLTASGGVSYIWMHSTFSADFLLGSGRRSDEILADGASIPNGGHLPNHGQVNLGVTTYSTATMPAR